MVQRERTHQPAQPLHITHRVPVALPHQIDMEDQHQHPRAAHNAASTTATSLDETLSLLITAFHILHHQGLLDECGHVSVRNPDDPSTFFTSNVPAILLSSRRHLSQWNVRDGSPVTDPVGGCTASEPTSDSEHFMDSCIYDMYPGVQSVVHSQCLSTMVYGLCNSRGSMLQATYQGAGFLGDHTPIFDAEHHYSTRLSDPYPRNLCINNLTLGDRLAQTFTRDQDMEMDERMGSEVDGALGLDDNNCPDCCVVFLRGHGFVTWAVSIEDAVYRAIHVRRNADIQTSAMAQRNSTDMEVVYLSQRECKDCKETINKATPQMWLAWSAHAERSGLYRTERGGGGRSTGAGEGSTASLPCP
ncbi:hypothetical protein ABEF95_010782 [Exophiala dermatitidis]